MPQMLVQRVDIVTGGASAAWGSDAVAGVVNFVTDKRFEGFKLNMDVGLSTYGDMGNVTFQSAAAQLCRRSGALRNCFGIQLQ